ncbi:MAG TPA: class I SAM-dependent methyltransferase [Verrucomicrobiota bacterium]|nr:class I SAM-dependent methyltransferase [Verrucomicrobiota bacterium]
MTPESDQTALEGSPESNGLPFEWEALQEAKNYRIALLSEFRPWLRGLTLEIGAGIGQFTETLSSLLPPETIIALEPTPRFCVCLRQRLSRARIVCGTSACLGAACTPNAIVSVNVLEHIDDDLAELKRYRQLLQPRSGRLCLFVPARPELFSSLDRAFGHYRRYTRPELRQKLQASGFHLERLHYFNLLGYLAWWGSFRFLGRRRFDPILVRFFDRFLFPAVHALESRVCRPPLGQSLLAVATA